MNRNSWSHLLSKVQQLVEVVASEALHTWGTAEPETKADETFVTMVDRRNEDRLATELTSLLPGSVFAGEEAGRRGDTDAGLVWVCDPIDGTLNYVKGLPHWCVSVGLLEDGVPVLGVVHAPVLRATYAAAAGAGATLNGRKLEAVAPARLIHEDLICASTNALHTLDFAEIPCRIRCLGSIALEACLVAEGRAVAAIGLGEGIVDLAASLCICGEAGAQARYLFNGPLEAAQLMNAWRTREPFFLGSEAVWGLLNGAVAVRPD